MNKKYNRRDFTKIIGASIGAAGAMPIAYAANGQSNVMTSENISNSDDKDLSSLADKFATKSAALTNLTNESVTPVHMGVVVNDSYRRYTSDPTVSTLELAMAELEGGEAALASSSGMTSITHTLISLLSSGDTVLYHHSLYASSTWFIEQDLPRFGVKVVKADMTNLRQVESLIAEHKPTMVYFEPNTNPYLEVVDVEGVLRLTKDTESLVVVDNTFMTPMLMQPLNLGADLVLHSMTKFIGGHGDALAGVVVGKKELIEKVLFTRQKMGGNLTPEKAYLILRGLRTLAYRMPVHCQSSLKLAKWLEKHPKVVQVNYPGLRSNVGYDIATRQGAAYGGMLSFVVKGGTNTGEGILRNLKLCKVRSSLGEPDTLVMGGKELEDFFKTKPGFLRVAVGLEGIDDIIEDFDRALS